MYRRPCDCQTFVVNFGRGFFFSGGGNTIGIEILISRGSGEDGFNPQFGDTEISANMSMAEVAVMACSSLKVVSG